MFEPEYQDMDCPKCLHRRVYFDREIGCYCMSCGYELSIKEMVMLIEKAALTSRPMSSSGKSEKKPIREIRELPPRKARVEHISHDVNEHEKPER